VLQVAADPTRVAAAELAAVSVIMAVGPAPQQQIAQFCRSIGEAVPQLDPLTLSAGEVLYWRRARDKAPALLQFGSSRPGSTS
jgi:hypothetical protein